MSDPNDFAGLDLRRFNSLSPLEQLDKLTADSDRPHAYEKRMRAAEAELEAKGGTDGSDVTKKQEHV